MIKGIKNFILEGKKEKTNYVAVSVSQGSAKDELEGIQSYLKAGEEKKQALDDLSEKWLKVEETLKNPISYNDLKNEDLLAISEDIDYKIDLETKEVIVGELDERAALESLAKMNPVLNNLDGEEIVKVISILS